MTDSKTIISGAEEKMDMAIMYLDDALAHIRAGKADVRLLDGIRVDSYGSMVPINNVNMNLNFGFSVAMGGPAKWEHKAKKAERRGVTTTTSVKR